MFRLDFDDSFIKNYKKLIKGNKPLEQKVEKALNLLMQDPKHPSLKSHLVISKFGESIWSSWVSGDVRIGWQYDSDKILTIYIVTIGKHSGSTRIYSKKS